MSLVLTLDKHSQIRIMNGKEQVILKLATKAPHFRTKLCFDAPEEIKIRRESKEDGNTTST